MPQVQEYLAQQVQRVQQELVLREPQVQQGLLALRGLPEQLALELPEQLVRLVLLELAEPLVPREQLAPE